MRSATNVREITNVELDSYSGDNLILSVTHFKTTGDGATTRLHVPPWMVEIVVRELMKGLASRAKDAEGLVIDTVHAAQTASGRPPS